VKVKTKKVIFKLGRMQICFIARNCTKSSPIIEGIEDCRNEVQVQNSSSDDLKRRIRCRSRISGNQRYSVTTKADTGEG
jgi:hypothetical protein